MCNASDGLGTCISIYNRPDVIENKQGIGKRLKRGEKRVTRRENDTVGRLYTCHLTIALPFTSSIPGNDDSFLLGPQQICRNAMTAKETSKQSIRIPGAISVLVGCQANQLGVS